MDKAELRHRILELKEKHNAAILVHNYQRPEIQELADYLGDSLDLARRSRALDNPVIVFCGVHFMAESAAILSPEKKILLPSLDAGCPLADCATPEMVRKARAEHPDAVFIAYINTSAAVKAEVDVTCTSANAFTILEHYRNRKICYLPDKNLAAYAAMKLDLDIIKWPGQCYVHDKLITPELVAELKKKHPDAYIMAHPEAPMEVLELADLVTGTSGMVKIAGADEHHKFVVVTETGLTHRLQNEFQEKTFIEVPGAICSQMKITTLDALHDALKLQQHVISVPEDIAARARKALNRMLELTK